MAIWLRQPYTLAFQRSFIEGTQHQLIWDQVERDLHVAKPQELVLIRQTCVEEMHIWLRTNALTTSQVQAKRRQITMHSTPSHELDGKGLNQAPCCLAIILHGVFLGRFGAEPNIRISNGFNQDRFPSPRWDTDLLKDTPLGAHRLFLDSLLTEDFTAGTLQGPIPHARMLSGYVWEDTKLIFLIPSRHLSGGAST